MDFFKNIFITIFKLCLTRKSNPFHGFLNGLCSSHNHFTPQDFYSLSYDLNAGWWNHPYFVSIFWLPLRYRPRFDLPPQEFSTWKPHNIDHTSKLLPFSQDFSPWGQTSMTLSWEPPLGCPISRPGDIVLASGRCYLGELLTTHCVLNTICVQLFQVF